MNNSPRISIIMGVYLPNREYLFTSVESIVSQTFKDWELIICDDGSNNIETDALLSEISKIDSRIKIIGYKKNMGLAYALNTCITNSYGEYIARQDDDDCSQSDRLSIQVEYLDAHHECSYVGTEAIVFDDKGQWGHYSLIESPEPRSFLWNSPFIHPSVMFRREALSAVNGYRVAPETERVEDYDLFMRLVAAGYNGHNLKSELYEYRINRSVKKYRPLRIRFNEAKVRRQGFKALELGIVAAPYVIKPIFIGLIPGFMMNAIGKAKY